MWVYSELSKNFNESFSESSKVVKLAALAAVLAHGIPPLTTWSGNQQWPDASHCCHNRMCVNPAHIVFERRDRNLRRYGCRNGAAFLCRCKTKRCIWVRDGRFLACRNDPAKRELVCDADCDLQCFGTFPFLSFSEFAIVIADIALNIIDLDDDADGEARDAHENDAEDEARAMHTSTRRATIRTKLWKTNSSRSLKRTKSCRKIARARRRRFILQVSN